MIIGDKNRNIGLIVSTMKPDGSQTEVNISPSNGDYDEYTSFAEDILSSIKDGSVKKLSNCLRKFHEMIKDEDMEQDMDE